MKTFFSLLLFCVSGFLGVFAQGYQQTESGVKITSQGMDVEVTFYSPSIVRVLKYPTGKYPDKQSLSVTMQPKALSVNTLFTDGVVSLTSTHLTVQLNLETGKVFFKDLLGNLLFTEKDYGTQFTEINYPSGKRYIVRQAFLLEPDEVIYGLGQQQGGKMNQRNQRLFLRQENMKVCIPYIASVKGYGVFWDNYSPTTFTDNRQETSFESESGLCSDYYFMYGGSGDGTVAQMRLLTGQAPMPPLWTFGFWQSRERYKSQEELLNVIKEYRRLGIPLDGIIQDWQYWSTDNAYWNAMEFGNPEFPDPQGMLDKIHAQNVHAMISVWANFGPKTKPFATLKEKNMLIPVDTWPHKSGVHPYDPYHPEARDIYWDYLDKGIFSLGMDAWWLDSTEPDHFNIRDKNFDLPTYLGPWRDVRNAFPLMSNKGVYEHQRAMASDKRVYILTRSAFAGQQRYAANTWSGDVDSRWDVFRKQIAAGLNFTVCGIPYWNTDIGGFFSHKLYPKGIKDDAYKELYVRWLQFGTFTPMMRSHGTDTPREIYQFGSRGEWAFDIQEKFINLRYALLPYLYSTAWDVTKNNGSFMRALFMDFPQDKNVYDLDNEFMFGKSFLVVPVTEPMYVNRDREVTIGQTKKQSVYLPSSDWYDFWSGDRITGGRQIERETPIDLIPVYVKAGSILPLGPEVQYATEKKWEHLVLRIYPGKDATFVLYEDENDNYNYERGAYTEIMITWDEKEQTLTIGERMGQGFDGMLKKRRFIIQLPDGKVSKIVSYSGRRLKIKL